MRRRRLLGLGAGALPLLAGCLGTPGTPRTDGSGSPSDDGTDEPTTTPRPDAIETYTWNGRPRLARTDAAYPQGAVRPYFIALLRTASEASAFREAFLAESDGDAVAGAGAFLADTDFAAEGVVVVRDATGSSHPDLAVESVAFVGETVRLRAVYPGRGRTADTIEDALLARVAGSPTAAEVTLGEGATAPTVATRNAIDAPALADPRALVVRNRDCVAHGVGLDTRIDGVLVANPGVAAPAGSVRVVADTFPYAADYDVRAGLDGTDRASEAGVSIAPDDSRPVLVDIDGRGEPAVARLDGTPSERRTDCEAESRPYESSDPSENIDGSVTLWVVSQAPNARRLAVTVADGGTRVFQRTFDLAGGGDKAREAGLLRKRGQYTVTVAPESGGTVETTVEVAEGTSMLTVRVGASGAIRIHTE